MKTKTYLIMICATMILCGCKSCGKKVISIVDKPKPLNISIYIDLSDRLTRELTPSQKERDLAIVGYITDFFKKRTLGPQIMQSKNKIKVFFYPAPQSSDIAKLAGELNVEMEKYEGKDKRLALEHMNNNFTKNLSTIYDKTLEQKKWTGCDIWDFFSNKNVDIQCMDKDARNILIILTDGYLYDANHKVKEGNAFSFVTPTTLKNPNASLIVKRTGLENLEVHILEVNPYDINHRDQLVSVLKNWLKGMGVRNENITISETGLPINTQTVIESFLNK